MKILSKLALTFSLFILILLMDCRSTGKVLIMAQCSDGIQNGDETGVDCGGTCETLGLPPCLVGVADLHAHPASHLAFGASDGTGRGLFWGKPYNPHQLPIEIDLQNCSPDKHSGFTGDLVEHRTKIEVIQSLDKASKGRFNHTEDGPNNYFSWPHALSISHQQMHVEWIRRAYEGGLKLLVASTVDNEILDMLWKRKTNSGKDTPTKHIFDYASAIEQLNFIKEMVDHHDWMIIVKDYEEAYNAINDGKLAIILGLEMDNLTIDQILELYDNHDVRLVTPIHLVDNSFGGAAVYDPLFNTANYWMNNYFFDVIEDDRLEFRLLPTQEKLEFGFSAAPSAVDDIYSSCAKSSGSPSVFANDNNFAIAWVGTNSPGRLRWALRQDQGFQKRFIDDGYGRESKHPPSITLFNGRWYVAWTGTNSHHPYIHIMRSTDESGSRWVDHYKLDGQGGNPKAESSQKPFLLSANGTLSLFWVGSNNPGKVRTMTSIDGLNWGAKTIVLDPQNNPIHTSKGVSAAFFNNRYYLAWVTSGPNSMVKILRSSNSNTSVWSTFINPNGQNNVDINTPYSPHLLATNNAIHLTYSNTAHLNYGYKMYWVKSSDGQNWDNPRLISDWRHRITQNGPQLAFQNNTYNLFWTGTSTGFIHSIQCKANNDSHWFNHIKNYGCPGHRNLRGISNSNLIERLMEKGYLIDISHMSQASIDDVLDIAENYGYPLINTHTGVQSSTYINKSERDLNFTQMQRLKELGGVIGLGTSWNSDADDPLLDWVEKYEYARSILGYPLAIGTDFNGLSTQIPNTNVSLSYPFNLNGNSFDNFRLGNRAFDFSTHGIVNYAMIPDFIASISEENEDISNDLFSSCQTMVNMWRRVSIAKKGFERQD